MFSLSSYIYTNVCNCWVIWFLRSTKLFSSIALPSYMPISSEERLQCLHICPNRFYYYLSFLLSPSWGCKVVSHCGFDLHCPNHQWCWTSFHVLIGHLNICFGECLFRCFAHFYLGYLPFYCCTTRVFILSGYKSLWPSFLSPKFKDAQNIVTKKLYVRNNISNRRFF